MKIFRRWKWNIAKRKFISEFKKNRDVKAQFSNIFSALKKAWLNEEIKRNYFK